VLFNEKLKDTNGVIKGANRRTENTMAKRKRKNETTTVYKSLLRKTNIAKI
jgi:hypothetical protein